MYRRFFLLFVLMLVSFYGYSQHEKVRVYVEDGISDSLLLQNIEKNVAHLMSSFNSTVITGNSRLKLEEDCFTKEGLECVKELWKSSAMISPLSSITEKCLMLGSGYQMRNIPIVMLAADEDDQDQELVINFTPTGEIDNVLVALEQHRYMEIIRANNSVKDFVRRQTVIEFIENFRTSYNRKDLDYINSVFSNDALIITGRVVKIKKGSDEVLQSLGQELVQYQTSTKEEYIKNLKRCFSRNAYINLKFEELEVVRHPKYEHIYGVTLKQYWNSSNYSDVGYLFLMIDFTDPSLPCIQVRTWQPEKYNGQKIKRDEVFELSDFSI